MQPAALLDGVAQLGREAGREGRFQVAQGQAPQRSGLRVAPVLRDRVRHVEDGLQARHVGGSERVVADGAQDRPVRAAEACPGQVLPHVGVQEAGRAAQGLRQERDLQAPLPGVAGLALPAQETAAVVQERGQRGLPGVLAPAPGQGLGQAPHRQGVREAAGLESGLQGGGQGRPVEPARRDAGQDAGVQPGRAVQPGRQVRAQVRGGHVGHGPADDGEMGGDLPLRRAPARRPPSAQAPQEGRRAPPAPGGGRVGAHDEVQFPVRMLGLEAGQSLHGVDPPPAEELAGLDAGAAAPARRQGGDQAPAHQA